MKKIIALACFYFALTNARAQTFTVASADLGGQFTNEFVAGNFGCNGSNRSPELHWTNAPAGTKSFAVTMYDADAPTGSGFWHWVITDIPASAKQIKTGSGTNAGLLPTGSVQHLNDTGAAGYQGPCPGEGEPAHRYIITLYALNTAKLGAPANATAPLTGFLLNKAAIAKASLVVYCKR